MVGIKKRITWFNGRQQFKIDPFADFKLEALFLDDDVFWHVGVGVSVIDVADVIIVEIDVAFSSDGVDDFVADT